MKVEIIVGSMLGATEYVADEVERILLEHDIKVTIHLTPDISELDTTIPWFICTSTHGAGDLPDNIQPFAKQLEDQQLTQVNYQIIALGDSNYDTFCQAGHTMDELMKGCHAQPLSPILTVDVDEHMEPELVVADWLNSKMPDLLS